MFPIQTYSLLFNLPKRLVKQVISPLINKFGESYDTTYTFNEEIMYKTSDDDIHGKMVWYYVCIKIPHYQIIGINEKRDYLEFTLFDDIRVCWRKEKGITITQNNWDVIA